MEKLTFPASANLRRWLRRVGLGGFLFFLLKGIVWLVIGYFATR
jgi:hypothetical protein